MKRIQTYLDATTADLLTGYAKENGCSLSHATGKIIAPYLMGAEPQGEQHLAQKQQFLRLLNILNQVLLCVYDGDKVSIPSQSAQDCLEQIKQSVLALTE